MKLIKVQHPLYTSYITCTFTAKHAGHIVVRIIQCLQNTNITEENIIVFKTFLTLCDRQMSIDDLDFILVPGYHACIQTS